MKTYTATKRSIKGTNCETTFRTFKNEEKAENQAQGWFDELTARGYVLTNIQMGRLSKSGEDVYISVIY